MTDEKNRQSQPANKPESVHIDRSGPADVPVRELVNSAGFKQQVSEAREWVNKNLRAPRKAAG
jgi:hypothetical protein